MYGQVSSQSRARMTECEDPRWDSDIPQQTNIRTTSYVSARAVHSIPWLPLLQGSVAETMPNFGPSNLKHSPSLALYGCYSCHSSHVWGLCQCLSVTQRCFCSTNRSSWIDPSLWPCVVCPCPILPMCWKYRTLWSYISMVSHRRYIHISLLIYRAGFCIID